MGTYRGPWDLGYPQSSLSLNRPARSPQHVMAGDRAPDAPIRGAAGQKTRLFKLFQGPHWTLLGYEVDRATIAPRRDLHIHTVGVRGDIVDESGYLRDAYGVSAGWVLVRPDGYVGAMVAMKSASASLVCARAGPPSMDDSRPSSRLAPSGEVYRAGGLALLGGNRAPGGGVAIFTERSERHGRDCFADRKRDRHSRPRVG
jgi:hypothetical protein